MNIIFEGIDASGKTTLLNETLKVLIEKGEKAEYIREIGNTPLQLLLNDMLSKDLFFQSKEKFNTSIYETFLLAAGFFYKQESLRNNTETINLFDRDIITLISYQKNIIFQEYGEKCKKFLENLEECFLFDLKKIDLVVYVSIDKEETFNRILARDNVILNEEQKKFLLDSKHQMEKTLSSLIEKSNIPVLYINGQNEISENVKAIVEEIICKN
ncbi:MAG: deoxynucleoside kinase [Leptotrichiaceae bacterium]|jgi:thymidylate kinase|nr:deoxynucleoside kinase [Leptotrichiaceae bacterium]